MRSRLACGEGGQARGIGSPNDEVPHQPEDDEMTAYRNKYLEALKAEKSKKSLVREYSKSSKLNFEDFESTQTGGVSKISPPLDAEGVPCGGCPTCGQGEFWRWSRSHPKHNPTGWICLFCVPPPAE